MLRLDGASKRYGGVRALEKADLTVEPGRVHAILGENGAGKSPLIKIIAGVIQPDEGAILFEGREVRLARPADANAMMDAVNASVPPDVTTTWVSASKSRS